MLAPACTVCVVVPVWMLMRLSPARAVAECRKLDCDADALFTLVEHSRNIQFQLGVGIRAEPAVA